MNTWKDNSVGISMKASVIPILLLPAYELAVGSGQGAYQIAGFTQFTGSPPESSKIKRMRMVYCQELMS